jgi:hypothetical protein
MRRAVRVEDLSKAEIALIMAADIDPEDRYEIEDIADKNQKRLRRNARIVTSARSKR